MFRKYVAFRSNKVLGCVSRMNINVPIDAAPPYHLVRIRDHSRPRVYLRRSRPPKTPIASLFLAQRSHPSRVQGPKTVSLELFRNGLQIHTGPRRGPKPNKAAAAPRFSIRITSAIVPPPRDNGAAPAQPVMNRKTISWAVVLLKAQEITKMKNMKLHVW